jgi:hypothetical protein
LNAWEKIILHRLFLDFGLMEYNGMKLIKFKCNQSSLNCTVVVSQIFFVN